MVIILHSRDLAGRNVSTLPPTRLNLGKLLGSQPRPGLIYHAAAFVTATRTFYLLCEQAVPTVECWVIACFRWRCPRSHRLPGMVSCRQKLPIELEVLSSIKDFSLVLGTQTYLMNEISLTFILVMLPQQKKSMVMDSLSKETCKCYCENSNWVSFVWL